MKSRLQNKALTEHTTNSAHALFHFTERHEHATFPNKHRGAEHSQSFHVKAYRCSQIKRARACFHSVTLDWNKMIHSYFLFHIFIFYIYICIFLKTKTFKTTPVHLLHTIGSQKYFGHFAFRQTAAFHYKKGDLNTHTNTTDEKRDTHVENRKLCLFFSILKLCN